MTERTANEIWTGASFSASSLGHALVRAWHTLETWRRRVRERAELAAMDERSLADMAISRADVWQECHKPFWRE